MLCYACHGQIVWPYRGPCPVCHGMGRLADGDACPPGPAQERPGVDKALLQFRLNRASARSGKGKPAPLFQKSPGASAA